MNDFAENLAAERRTAVRLLLTVYSHCIHGRDDLLKRQIDHPQAVPGAWSVPVRGRASGVRRPRDYAEASGYTDHATTARSAADAVRHASVTPPARPADGPQITPTAGHRSILIDNV